MSRLLLCLPLCLLVAPDRYRPVAPAPAPAEGTFAVVTDDGDALPDNAAMLALAVRDPVTFLEMCIRRCQREVHSARLILRKHERTLGQQRKPEEIAVDYRVAPHAVLFHWRKGGPDLAAASLYAADQLPGKVLIRPAGLAALVGNVERDVRGEDAQKAGRYSLEEFGFALAMRRTLGCWRAAQAEHALHVEFLGIRPCAEVGGRRCYIFHRHHYARPEQPDNITDLVIYIDAQTWLQTGSILKNSHGQLVGSYFFEPVEINPKLDAARFTPAGLAKP